MPGGCRRSALYLSFPATKPVADIATAWECAARAVLRDSSTSLARSAARYLLFRHTASDNFNTTGKKQQQKRQLMARKLASA